MGYHKPVLKRRRSANRRLSMRGMSAARHDFEVMHSQARRAGEAPPSFAAEPRGCSAECTIVHTLQSKEDASDQRRWWPITFSGQKADAASPPTLRTVG